MMLLAQWGKPYQDVSTTLREYGAIMADEAQLLSSDMGVCHVPAFRYIWLFASDKLRHPLHLRDFYVMTANVQPDPAPYAHP